jgi:hypothetical protein
MFAHDLVDLRVWNDVKSDRCHWLNEYPRDHFPIDKRGSIPAQKWPLLMDTTKLTTVISLIVALSIASERLVDIIKGLVPWLNQPRRKTAEEGWRKAALQILAVIAGITTAWLASAAIPKGVGIPDDWTGTLALGLLASGGSGFWNSILTYVTKAKDLKAAEAETKQIEVRAKRGTPKHGH